MSKLYASTLAAWEKASVVVGRSHPASKKTYEAPVDRVRTLDDLRAWVEGNIRINQGNAFRWQIKNANGRVLAMGFFTFHQVPAQQKNVPEGQLQEG